jgi:hypothetical protein
VKDTKRTKRAITPRTREARAMRSFLKGAKGLASVYHITASAEDAALYQFLTRGMAWMIIAAGRNLSDPHLADMLRCLAQRYDWRRPIATKAVKP